MESKQDLIRSTIHDLIRVAKMYSRIEELPITVHEELEITTREAHTIQTVGENELISITQLASYFGITKSAASQMVTRLVKKNLLFKKQAPHSNKEFQLSLTEPGWQAFKAHEQFHGKDMSEVMKRLSGFSISQIATLSVLLETISGIMEKRLNERLKK